jgi:TonB family protein
MGEISATPKFQSLELSGTPWTRWVSSLAINAGAILALIVIPVTVHQVIQPPSRIATLSLVPPAHTTPPKPLPVMPTVVKSAPVVEFHAPPVKPPEAKTITVPPPPIDIPKPPEVVRVEAPKIDPPARPAIKQEVFPANPVEPVSPEAPVKTIKTGGFGDPNGVPSVAASSKSLTVQKIGSFDSPTGQGSGSAKARVVASAGFGSAAVADAGANGHAPVRGAGFGEYDASPRGAQAARTAAPVETPVEITFKPKPLYTPEARAKKIEGEVQLEVVFASSGGIRVLRVIHGLGFGLDENARAAAGQIQFRPGTRNGSPVDVTGIVHIVFELS